ncbi:MAG TPA: hypothetical protein VHX38_16760 [Pseudonocardiaceae bacterium]|jgi:hypothetical protein|nr:hypothetical protein [Pseudonocardiaceae bacterium]
MSYSPGDWVELVRDVEGGSAGQRGWVTNVSNFGGLNIALVTGARLTSVDGSAVTVAPPGQDSGDGACGLALVAAAMASGWPGGQVGSTATPAATTPVNQPLPPPRPPEQPDTATAPALSWAQPPLPTIGVDPGQTWTAAVLRVGDTAVHGWTMGPVDRSGTVIRDALNEVDNWDAFALYTARLVEGLDELADYARTRWGEVRIGIEVPGVPIGWRPGSPPKFQRLPMRDWLIPRQVAAAVLGAYPQARLIRPDHLGRRPAHEYPADLRGARPPSWGPCEARKGERDHERAAYDVAGRAMVLPR